MCPSSSRHKEMQDHCLLFKVSPCSYLSYLCYHVSLGLFIHINLFENSRVHLNRLIANNHLMAINSHWENSALLSWFQFRPCWFHCCLGSRLCTVSASLIIPKCNYISNRKSFSRSQPWPQQLDHEVHGIPGDRAKDWFPFQRGLQSGPYAPKY